jgi:hypothetical protein
MEGSYIEGRHQKLRYTPRECLRFTLKVTEFQDLVHHLISKQVRQYPQAPNLCCFRSVVLLNFQFCVQSNKKHRKCKYLKLYFHLLHIRVFNNRFSVHHNRYFANIEIYPLYSL